MMRTIASVVAATTLAAAGAAAAQSIDDRIDSIESQIDQGVDDQAITPYQADQLREDLTRVRDQRDRLENAGELTGWRRRDLQARLNNLQDQVGRAEYFGRFGTYRGYYRGWTRDED